MLSNMRIGAIMEGARARFTLLGSLSACSGAIVSLAIGCSSSSPSSEPPSRQSSVSTLPTCGNGVIDPLEDCDGANLNSATCATATKNVAPVGVLKCGGCRFDMSGCTTTSGSVPTSLPTGTGAPPPAVGTGGWPIGGGSGGSSGITPIGSGGTTPVGSGGFTPLGSGGTVPIGEGGAAPTPGAGGATPAPMGKQNPVIPQVSGDCPMWANSTITYMGLSGILIAAGPKPAGPTAPMLVYWHGTGTTSNEYVLLAAPVANGVTQAGGVIVSFQNTTGGDLYSGTSIFGQGDLKIVDQLVACAVRDHNIDPRKIYTMGCSAGGLFSTAMAGLRSSYVAAAAPNSGGIVLPPAFDSSHVPPLMTVHGAMGSDMVIVDFSQTSASADMLFKGKGGFVIDCNTGGGHCGGAGLAGDAWTFFQAHPYGVDPEPWAGGLPAGFSSQCKIQ